MPSPRGSTPPPPTEILRARDVSALLASTLGWEKSDELVLRHVRATGLDEAHLTREDALSILDALGASSGIIGVTARFARSRVASLPPAAPAAAPATAPRRLTNPARAVTATHARELPSSPKEPARRLSTNDLAALLAPSLGEEKARECLLTVLRERGLSREDLSIEEATLAFTDLAGTPGIVGVTARFAKARLVARYASG